MTRPFDVLNLTDHVADSAGSLAGAFRPFLIAQADVSEGKVEFLPWLFRQLLSYLDLNLLKGLVLAHGGKVFSAIAVFVVGRMVARLASAMMVRASKKARVDQTLMGFVSNVAYVLMLGAVCIASLSCLGVDTTSLTAVLAAAGFAVGMALQGTLGNFASGALLVFF